MALLENQERKKLYNFVAEFLHREKVTRNVLDIACSDGQGTDIMVRVLNCKVVGFDISKENIRKAMIKHKSVNTEFIEGDARRTGLPSVSFDAIVSLHTIEHVNEDDQIIMTREFKRILRPQGLLIIATPDRDVYKLQGIAGAQKDHLKELNRREMEKLLSENGFSILDVYGQFILKKGENFRFRKILNFIKKLDVFRLRRFLGKKFIDSVDMKTQPNLTTGEVVKLKESDKAAVNIFVCGAEKNVD